ncbi:hypothetical protein BC826DRAFT_1109908 [Russula brevipes]|nr:hypothetical protein BC826DRAFT_1109908 [Russula brevipes]
MVACDHANILLFTLGMGVATLFFRVSVHVTVHALEEVTTVPGVVPVVLTPLAFVFREFFLLTPCVGKILDSAVADGSQEFFCVRQIVEDAWFKAGVGVGRCEVVKAGTDVSTELDELLSVFREFDGALLHFTMILTVVLDLCGQGGVAVLLSRQVDEAREHLTLGEGKFLLPDHTPVPVSGKDLGVVFFFVEADEVGGGHSAVVVGDLVMVYRSQSPFVLEPALSGVESRVGA